MKNHHLLSAVLAFLFISVSVACNKSGREEKDNASVLIYAAGNNSLSVNTYDLIDQLKKGVLSAKYTDDKMVLLYVHSAGKQPLLCKITRRADGSGIDSTILAVYGEDTNSATVEQFHKVLSDAKSLCPAKHRGLVLWSHATGYLPEGYTSNPDRVSARSPKTAFGNDYNNTSREIEIQDLVAALPETYEYVIFDCCLMGSIEVAYEFKDVCKYLIFSPTEILTQGFPYYMMMDRLFNEPDLEKALTGIAEEYYQYYLKEYNSTSRSSTPRGGTITLVRTDKLEQFAQVCRPLFEKYRTAILNLDPKTIQNYFRYDHGNWHWFYDLGDIVGKVAAPDEYETFEKSLNETIVYKGATPRFLSIPINRYSGYSVYLPSLSNTRLNTYYRNLQWNQATGLLW